MIPLSRVRLTTKNGGFIGVIKSLAAWQQTPSIRLCSSKVGQKTGDQGQTQSTETSPAVAEAKPAEAEASTAPSLADMSRDVSYRQ